MIIPIEILILILVLNGIMFTILAIIGFSWLLDFVEWLGTDWFSDLFEGMK